MLIRKKNITGHYQGNFHLNMVMLLCCNNIFVIADQQNVSVKQCLHFLTMTRNTKLIIMVIKCAMWSDLAGMVV